MIPETLLARYQFSAEFNKLVRFFNKLEESLEYPNSEGYSEQVRRLQKAETDLFLWGKL